MRNLMQYARQLHQRRISAFFLSSHDQPQEQLQLSLVPTQRERLNQLRRLAAEQEYDNEDERD